MRKWLWYSILLFFLVTKAGAVTTDPVTVNLLTQQLASMKLLLENARKELSEMKVASDGVLKVRDTIDDVRKEYEALINLDLRNEFLYIKEKYAALTNLDDLKDATTFREKYALLHEEIGLRFKGEKKSGKASFDSSEKAVGTLEEDIQATLMHLNKVDVELAHYKDRAESGGSKKSTDKDYQRAIAQASSATTSLMLEQQRQALVAQRQQQDAFMGEMIWNQQFLRFLADPKSSSGSIEDNWLTRFIVQTLNPSFVYKGMTLVTAVPTLFLWLLVLFAAFRLFQEGLGSMHGKSSIGSALQSMGGTVTTYIAYFSSGFLIFSLIFAYFSLFEGVGSVDYIHTNMLALRESLVVKSSYDGWLLSAAKNALDYFNIISAGFTWALYQGVSVVYVIASQLIDILFALLVAFLWVFGFIAITTGVLKGRYNLTGVWAVSVYGLFLWGIIELILMALLAGFNYFSVSWIELNYMGFGSGFTAVTIWHLYCVVQMLLILILKLLAIWFAYQFSQHQSVVGSVAGAASVITTFLAYKSVPSGGDLMKNSLGGMSPDASGDRKRDVLGRFSEGISQAMNAPVSDVARSGVVKLKDIFVSPSDPTISSDQSTSDRETREPPPGKEPS